MPRVVLPGDEAERVMLEIKFENLPRFLNSKSRYIRWASKRRLENKDFGMQSFVEENPNDGLVA